MAVPLGFAVYTSGEFSLLLLKIPCGLHDQAKASLVEDERDVASESLLLQQELLKPQKESHLVDQQLNTDTR